MAATDLSTALASVLQVPGMQELMNNIITEQRQQAPLRSATKQMAAGMMPSYAFGSAGRPDIGAIPRANFSTPAPSSSGMSLQDILPWLLVAAGGAKAATSQGSPLANAIKKLFGGGGGNTGLSANPSAGNSAFDGSGLFTGPSSFSGNGGPDPFGGAAADWQPPNLGTGDTSGTLGAYYNDPVADAPDYSDQYNYGA